MGHPPGSSRPRWAVAGLLLFATAILYMDRQTLAAASVRVTLAFGLTQEQYGTPLLFIADVVTGCKF